MLRLTARNMGEQKPLLGGVPTLSPEPQGSNKLLDGARGTLRCQGATAGLMGTGQHLLEPGDGWQRAATSSLPEPAAPRDVPQLSLGCWSELHGTFRHVGSTAQRAISPGLVSSAARKRWA